MFRNLPLVRDAGILKGALEVTPAWPVAVRGQSMMVEVCLLLASVACWGLRARPHVTLA